MLTGDYCFYNELTGNAIATRRAVAIDYSQGDSFSCMVIPCGW